MAAETAQKMNHSLEPVRLSGSRIVFVLPSLGLGGAERQAFLLARHLLNREEAQVRFVSLGGLGEISRQCDEIGIPYETFELRHSGGRRLHQVADVVRFVLFLRRRGVDILLPYCMFQNVFCALTWRAGGARVCIWNQRDEGRSRLQPGIERAAVRQIRCYVSNSHHGALFLTQTLGIPPGRVHVVHNGVELPAPQLAREAWRAKLGLPTTSFAACMVANLHRYKDHATLVAAWRVVVDRLTPGAYDPHLLLAGLQGDQYGPLAQQVTDLRLGGHVQFLGEVRDIAGLLGAVDLAVFSSYAEGLPNAVLEAMAAGLAVVGTDYPGIREAVGPVGEPLLVPRRDSAQLATAIVEMALDPRRRAALGHAGQQRVAADFGVGRMCDRMVELMLLELSRRSGIATIQ